MTAPSTTRRPADLAARRAQTAAARAASWESGRRRRIDRLIDQLAESAPPFTAEQQRRLAGLLARDRAAGAS